MLAQVRPGSIILSHDGGGPRGETLAAYPGIIRALRARGYRIVTIPELLGFRLIYQQCLRDCMGIGIPRKDVPDGAILQTRRLPALGRRRQDACSAASPGLLRIGLLRREPEGQNT